MTVEDFRVQGTRCHVELCDMECYTVVMNVWTWSTTKHMQIGVFNIWLVLSVPRLPVDPRQDPCFHVYTIY